MKGKLPIFNDVNQIVVAEIKTPALRGYFELNHLCQHDVNNASSNILCQHNLQTIFHAY